MSKLKIKYGDFIDGGIDMYFYFDNVKIQSFWFSLCIGSFKTITHFLEQLLDWNISDLIYKSEKLSDNQIVINQHSVILDGEGPDLEIKFEVIQTAIPCGGGTAYNYDSVRLSIIGYESDYLENEPVCHSMIGDKKQIINELYFSMMNVLGYELVNKSKQEKYYNQNPLQDYNDCKSIKIEEYLFPELENYYIDEETQVHLKQNIIRRAKILSSKDVNNKDIIREKIRYSKDCELFFLPKEYKSKISIWNNMRMVLPIEK